MKSIKILILIAIGAISFYSCSNSSSDILSKGELFLKESLDDPSSYQRISIEIIDTVRLDKFTKDLMYKVYDMNEIVSYELAASRVEFSKKELDSLVKYKRHTSTIKDFKESVIKKNRNSLDSLLSSVDSVYYIVSKEMLEKKSKELPGIESMFLKIEDNKIQITGKFNN